VKTRSELVQTAMKILNNENCRHEFLTQHEIGPRSGLPARSCLLRARQPGCGSSPPIADETQKMLKVPR
jgi:hypothetical protein